MTRIEAVKKTLAERDIDSLIVLDELNQQYLSGFAFTDGLLLITPKRSFLITDFRYYEMAQNEAFPELEVIIPENRKQTIEDIMKADGCRKVGFE